MADVETQSLPADENKNPTIATEDTSNEDSKGQNEDITVLHDKDNFNVKHPLMNEWTLWFTKPPSGKVCLVELGTDGQVRNEGHED